MIDKTVPIEDPFASPAVEEVIQPMETTLPDEMDTSSQTKADWDLPQAAQDSLATEGARQHSGLIEESTSQLHGTSTPKEIQEPTIHVEQPALEPQSQMKSPGGHLEQPILEIMPWNQDEGLVIGTGLLPEATTQEPQSQLDVGSSSQTANEPEVSQVAYDELPQASRSLRGTEESAIDLPSGKPSKKDKKKAKKQAKKLSRSNTLSEILPMAEEPITEQRESQLQATSETELSRVKEDSSQAPELAEEPTVVAEVQGVQNERLGDLEPSEVEADPAIKTPAFDDDPAIPSHTPAIHHQSPMTSVPEDAGATLEPSELLDVTSGVDMPAQDDDFKSLPAKKKNKKKGKKAKRSSGVATPVAETETPSLLVQETSSQNLNAGMTEPILNPEVTTEREQAEHDMSDSPLQRFKESGNGPIKRETEETPELLSTPAVNLDETSPASPHEPVIESVSEPIAVSIAEPALDHVIKHAVEPTVTDPLTESVAEHLYEPAAEFVEDLSSTASLKSPAAVTLESGPLDHAHLEHIEHDKNPEEDHPRSVQDIGPIITITPNEHDEHMSTVPDKSEPSTTDAFPEQAEHYLANEFQDMLSDFKPTPIDEIELPSMPRQTMSVDLASLMEQTGEASDMVSQDTAPNSPAISIPVTVSDTHDGILTPVADAGSRRQTGGIPDAEELQDDALTQQHGEFPQVSPIDYPTLDLASVSNAQSIADAMALGSPLAPGSDSIQEPSEKDLSKGILPGAEKQETTSHTGLTKLDTTNQSVHDEEQQSSRQEMALPLSKKDNMTDQKSSGQLVEPGQEKDKLPEGNAAVMVSPGGVPLTVTPAMLLPSDEDIQPTVLPQDKGEPSKAMAFLEPVAGAAFIAQAALTRKDNRKGEEEKNIIDDRAQQDVAIFDDRARWHPADEKETEKDTELQPNEEIGVEETTPHGQRSPNLGTTDDLYGTDGDDEDGEMGVNVDDEFMGVAEQSGERSHADEKMVTYLKGDRDDSHEADVKMVSTASDDATDGDKEIEEVSKIMPAGDAERSNSDTDEYHQEMTLSNETQRDLGVVSMPDTPSDIGSDNISEGAQAEAGLPKKSDENKDAVKADDTDSDQSSMGDFVKISSKDLDRDSPSASGRMSDTESDKEPSQSSLKAADLPADIAPEKPRDSVLSHLADKNKNETTDDESDKESIRSIVEQLKPKITEHASDSDSDGESEKTNVKKMDVLIAKAPMTPSDSESYDSGDGQENKTSDEVLDKRPGRSKLKELDTLGDIISEKNSDTDSERESEELSDGKLKMPIDKGSHSSDSESEEMSDKGEVKAIDVSDKSSDSDSDKMSVDDVNTHRSEQMSGIGLRKPDDQESDKTSDTDSVRADDRKLDKMSIASKKIQDKDLENSSDEESDRLSDKESNVTADRARGGLLAPKITRKGKEVDLRQASEILTESEGSWQERSRLGAQLDSEDFDESPVLGRAESDLSRLGPVGLLRLGSEVSGPAGGLLREESEVSTMLPEVASELSDFRRSPTRGLPPVQEIPEAEMEPI